MTKIQANFLIQCLGFLLLANFMPFNLCANTSELLSFQQLMEYSRDNIQELPNLHQRYIRIRGFLYRAEDGRLILAAEPNLKSCCLDKISIERQIAISGNLQMPIESGNIVVVEGKLIVDPTVDDNGQWKSLYLLEEVSVIKEESARNSKKLLFGISILMVIAVAAFLIMYRKS
jgi:hypothetical protein